MSAEIHLLDSAHTKNAQAWLARVAQEFGDADRLVVIAVREEETRASCSVDYFNMNEVWFSWAAARIGDCAASMRGAVIEEG